MLLILSGGGMTAWATLRHSNLLSRSARPGLSFSTREGNLLSRILSLLVVAGYLGLSIHVFFWTPGLMHLFLSAIFCLVGALLCTLVQEQTAIHTALVEKNGALENANVALESAMDEVATSNQALQQEVNSRVREVVWQESLLQTVNEVAALLLGSDVDSFDHTLFHCMEKMGTSVDVDRVYIWRNHMQGDELYCTQIYEWSGGADPQQGNELTMSVAFPADWYPNLSVNKCVNGSVTNFPQREREHLEAQGIVSILVVPIFLEGEFWGFVGFDDCRNIRDFSEAEEAILRSGSLLFAISYLRNEMTVDLVRAREEALSSSKAKTDFLATMSHEIRTPINAITGMSGIARVADSKERVQDCLDKIDTASRQLLALINDVLDMSKIEAGKLELASEPFDLRAMLHNVESIIGVRANEKQQDFHVELDAGLPQVIIGDDVRLTQVLTNLLTNAVKFTPAGGSIGLSAVCTGMTDGRAQLEMQVRDTGIGMSEEQIGRLFRKFEQADQSTSRRFGGTGLGLAISKSIMDIIDGDIAVESRPDSGSVFTVRFEALCADRETLHQPDAEPVPAVQYDFSGKRALLVEDIEINREIVLAMLEGTGLAIDQAQDGRVALEMFKANPEYYDLIFMDIHMPEMDGYESSRQIRGLDTAAAKAVPIIAMTANAFSDDVQRCLSAGMNDHLAKPLDPSLLFEKVAQYLA
ncbi:response regulator [Ruminococcaceae bacterium OttesenSCG-928-L11]|nr:response regulator [Ruminococcaceae bacterium OttesenSCG-928-L11]